MQAHWKTVAALVALSTLSLTRAEDPPAANPADVQSVDAILKALYDTISGPAGQKRDWNRFRSLFAPGARLIPTRPGAEGKPPTLRIMDVEEYIRLSEPFFNTEPFYEIEIARKTDTFGNITQVFSTYESRRAPDEAPFIRGINSIQIFGDGDRYWVVNIYWDNERPGLTIPEQYLPRPH